MLWKSYRKYYEKVVENVVYHKRMFARFVWISQLVTQKYGYLHFFATFMFALNFAMISGISLETHLIPQSSFMYFAASV